MQGLDFRRKRKKSTIRPAGRKSRPGKKRLRFENEKQSLYFKNEKRKKKTFSPKAAVLWAVEILLVCMAAVFLVAAFGQRISIAGDSMAPALRNGDTVLMNRLAYAVKSPARGDVVAIRAAGDSRYSVKRIVGLPGETVQISDGKILIDGEELSGSEYPEGITYAGLADEPIELGKDEYFVLGDNHTASNDSRSSEVGNISREEIYGTVWLIVSPLNRFGTI